MGTQQNSIVRSLICIFCAAILIVGPAYPQAVITTFAGTDFVFDGDGKRATAAPLGGITAVAVDRQGLILIADVVNRMIMRFSLNGNLSVIAGNGASGYSGDGALAISASIDEPRGIAVDPSGNIYISDDSNNVVRKISTAGIITTVAGGGAGGGIGDGGPGTNASLSRPTGLATDSAGNLYIADRGNHRIRKLSTTGVITTVAGDGNAGFSEGAPLNSSLDGPQGVAVDSAGNLYIADTGNNRIRRVSAEGTTITTVAGNGQDSFTTDGPATLVALNGPTAVAIDSGNNLYIADAGNNRVRKVTPAGGMTTLAGGPENGFDGDGGPATGALLNYPAGVAVDVSLNVYIADWDNSRVRRVSAQGFISTAAGNGTFGSTGDDGPALRASFRNPGDIALDGLGNLYVADYDANRVRKISADGIVTTVAGDGVPRFAGDGGPASSASLQGPVGVAAARDGTLYIADSGNNRVRRVTPAGTISTFAGAGSDGSEENGIPATRAYIDFPTGLALSPLGDLYIAASNASKVLKVSPSGILTTVAGNGDSGFSPAGGLATSVSLEGPTGLALDSAGNLYITERWGVRKVSPDGIITTVAGNGELGYFGDNGPATAAALDSPSGVVADASGGILIADTQNNRIRQVGTNNVIATVAGDGQYRFAGDGGPPAAASIALPRGLAFDGNGNLYVSDAGNQRIRRILAVATSFGVAPASLDFAAAATGSAPAPVTLNVSTPFSGTPFQLGVSTTDGGSWLAANALSGILPSAVQIFTDPGGLTAGVYRGTVTVRVPSANPPVRTVSVVLTVGQVEPPRLGADPASLSYSFVVGAAALARQVTISNRGGGSLNFSVATAVDSGSGWLTTSPASGSASAADPASITVTANPQGLAAGTYTGRVSINSSAAGAVTVPVTMTVATGAQTILLSQTGLTFTAVVGGGTPPPQDFGVLNIGQGVMNWSAAGTTLSGGAGWLTVTPSSGSTDASSLAVPRVNVAINTGGLAPGDYYGRIQVTAPGAGNTPQIVSVVLTVLPAGSDPGPLVRPTGLIFTTLAGGPGPTPQEIQISNLSARATSFISGRLSDNPGNLFTNLPVEGSVAPGQPTRIIVQPSLSGLQPQVYRGTLTLQFADGTPRTVGLLFVVVGGGASAAANPRGRFAENCTPTRVLPLFTSLSSDFNVPVAWPTPLDVRVVDDCGDPMTGGSVVASFSNGDPPLTMASLKDGRWSGTWQARNQGSSRLVVTLNAATTGGAVRGSAQVSGSLRANPDPPVVSPGGVVNSVGPPREAPVAPGSLISISGSRLSEAQSSAPAPPFPDQLDVTRVLFGGRLLALADVRADRINAQIPYDIPVNARYSLIVQRAVTGSSPEELTVAAAQPAIYTAGVFRLAADGTRTEANAQNPLRAGDRILIQCAGLGAVTPPIAAGIAAPADRQVSTVAPVGLRIGGVEATVSFAGLIAGQVGVYQVQASVPAGVSPGDAVPLVVTVAGQSSPAVMAVVR